MKTRQCRGEFGNLDLEKKLDRIIKKLGGATIFFGINSKSEIGYRRSAYFLESRNIAVGVFCYLGQRYPEYIINFYGPDDEIEKLEQSLEEEISLKEMDRKVREEEKQYKQQKVLYRPFGHYGGQWNQFYIR